MREPSPLTGNSPMEVWLEGLRRYAVGSHIIDSPDIRAHHSPHGVALTIESQAGGGTREGGGAIITAVAKSTTHDGVLLVRKIGKISSPTAQEDIIKVAMPWSLRMEPWDGQTVFFGISDSGSTLEYQETHTRLIKREVAPGEFVTISQRIWPPYQFEGPDATAYPPQGTILRIAKPEGGSGVWLNASGAIVDTDDPTAVEQLLHVDMNVDARTWHSEVNPYRICQNNVPYIGLFHAGMVEEA